MQTQFQILDGKRVSEEILKRLKSRVYEFKQNWGRGPSLHVILVGEDPASQIYVGRKEKMASEIGMDSKVWKLDSKVTQAELETVLLGRIQDPGVDGILVQLPLPKGLHADRILGMIPFEKDVDGFSEQAVGALVSGRPLAVSCTPAGVMEILKYYKIDVKGKNCVVVGRSQIVGKPMSMLLLNADATVTTCHSKTQGLTDFTRQADLVVVAAGKPHFLKALDFKKGAIVIDVGIHRDENNRVIGDVDPDGLSNVVAAATPVPGGVGPMTIAMLLENTLKIAEYRMEKGLS